jgi:uncharacterized damage-inducible protein DinB
VKRTALIATAVLLLATMSFGQALTEADKDKGIHYLEQTRDGVADAVKGLSDAQLKFKPAPDRWSIAEVLEHIALVEDGIFQNVSEKVMKAPAGSANRDAAKIDSLVLAALPDRSHKAKAPPEFVPTGRWTAAEALAHFQQSRERTISFLQATPDLREHAVDSPLGQPLDAYQWLLFMGGHSARHTKQIMEVKADPNFPKS